MEDDPSDAPTNHPLLMDEYVIFKHVDVSEQPSKNLICVPNECAIEIECSDEVLAAIELDSDYEVLWSEEIT
jgi:hypothetical protein